MSYGGLAAGGVPTDYNNGGYQIRVFRSKKPDGPYAFFCYRFMNFSKAS